MSIVHQHLVNNGEKLQKLVEDLQKLSNEPLSKLYPPEGKFRSDLHHTWLRLSKNVINPSSNFNHLMQAIRFRAADNIQITMDEYKSKCEDLLRHALESVHSVKNANEHYREARKQYENAWKAVQEAYDSKSPKLQQLRDEFVKAQNAAVEAHKEFNYQRFSMSTEYDRVLSDFEQIEQWRITSIRETLTKLSNDLERTARLFNDTSKGIKDAINEHDLTTDAKTISSFNDIKEPEASINFQWVTVPPTTSKFLNLSKCWEKDIANGAKIGYATKDFRGVREQIDVRADERVLVLEQVGDFLRCKNINDCVGLVPADVVKILDDS
ncbi:SH3 domain containing protein [Histomonas meleagridis]|uniref:SH3 domain containing protein n=1 Tax=Histomonas meleagridis TaxID=135588 RepID=UPI00355A57B0|nr:SH3 domain containing protein [Histomonas meleagridis]KAH0799112.1 SH3 domain containing protein [Histomonas meleagridis]